MEDGRDRARRSTGPSGDGGRRRAREESAEDVLARFGLLDSAAGNGAPAPPSPPTGGRAARRHAAEERELDADPYAPSTRARDLPPDGGGRRAARPAQPPSQSGRHASVPAGESRHGVRGTPEGTGRHASGAGLADAGPGTGSRSADAPREGRRAAGPLGEPGPSRGAAPGSTAQPRSGRRHAIDPEPEPRGAVTPPPPGRRAAAGPDDFGGPPVEPRRRRRAAPDHDEVPARRPSGRHAPAGEAPAAPQRGPAPRAQEAGAAPDRNGRPRGDAGPGALGRDQAPARARRSAADPAGPARRAAPESTGGSRSVPARSAGRPPDQPPRPASAGPTGTGRRRAVDPASEVDRSAPSQAVRRGTPPAAPAGRPAGPESTGGARRALPESTGGTRRSRPDTPADPTGRPSARKPESTGGTRRARPDTPPADATTAMHAGRRTPESTGGSRRALPDTPADPTGRRGVRTPESTGGTRRDQPGGPATGPRKPESTGGTRRSRSDTAADATTAMHAGRREGARPNSPGAAGADPAGTAVTRAVRRPAGPGDGPVLPPTAAETVAVPAAGRRQARPNHDSANHDSAPEAMAPDRSERAELARRIDRTSSVGDRASRIDETLTRLTAAHAGLTLAARDDDDAGLPPPRRKIRITPGRVLATALTLVVFMTTAFGWGTKSWLGASIGDAAALDPESGAIVDAAGQAGDENVLVVATEPGQADPAVPRADTVAVAHIPAGGSPVTVLSFPNDLEINRPPCERWDASTGSYTDETVPAEPRTPLAGALDVGGPRCVTRVVQQLSGLAVTKYVGMDLGAVRTMADAVGGVDVCVPRPVLDGALGPVVPDAGTSHIEGVRVADFVHAGEVQGDPTPDYGRIERQQQVLAAVLDKAVSGTSLLDVGRLAALRPALSKAVVADGVGLDELLALSLSLQHLDADGVTFAAVPTGQPNSRGQAALRDTDAAALFAAVRSNGPMPEQASDPAATDGPAPGDVTVEVLNGSARSGLANEVGETLRSLGFDVGDVHTADEPTQQTVIKFSPDQATAAALLAATVPSATSVPDPGASDVLAAGAGPLVRRGGPRAVRTDRPPVRDHALPRRGRDDMLLSACPYVHRRFTALRTRRSGIPLPS